MTTFEPKLGDPQTTKPLTYKGFVLAFFTGK
jgi:hypothetical protein